MKALSRPQSVGLRDSEIETVDGTRFASGKNWQSFVSDHLNQERIDEAKKSVVEFCDASNLIRGKTFIDVGCGSGHFSWWRINSVLLMLSAWTSILNQSGAVNYKVVVEN